MMMDSHDLSKHQLMARQSVDVDLSRRTVEDFSCQTNFTRDSGCQMDMSDGRSHVSDEGSMSPDGSASQPDDHGDDSFGAGSSGENQQDSSVSGTNLIVNYFPQELTEEEFKKTFGLFGEVDSCRLIRDSNTGIPTSYGFVNFKDPDVAQRAVAKLNGLAILGKRLKVSFARPQHEGMKGANLFIINIPRAWTCDDLNALFLEHGGIVTSRILTDKVSGVSTGKGFIRYERRSQAQAAMEKLHNFKPLGQDTALIIQPARGGRRFA